MAAQHKQRKIVLENGEQVLLRPVRADDKPLIAASFNRLSEQSRYRRFFLRLRQLPPPLLDALVDVDHHDREAIIALSVGTEEALGVARYTRLEDDSETAEIAVTVVDDRQGQGLGRALLQRLTARAREEGIRRFSAEVLGENQAAMGLFGTLGESSHRIDDGVVELVVSLPVKRGAGARLRTALRAAATGSLVPTRTLADHLRLSGYPGAGALQAYWPIRTIVAGDADPWTPAIEVASGLAARLQAALHLVTPDDDPARDLLRAAIEQDADLLVVDHAGMEQGGLSAHRALADRVSHHAPCNVLIVRRAAAASAR